MIHSLSLINLFVRDVQRSRQFYTEVLEIPVVGPCNAYLDYPPTFSR